MAKKKITIGGLGLKRRLLQVLADTLHVSDEEIKGVSVEELVPKLDHDQLERHRGLGLKTIANFRDKLKGLGYNDKTCPFLRQRTKREAKQKLEEQLKHCKLSERDFNLIWGIAQETLHTAGVLNWVEYLYDE